MLIAVIAETSLFAVEKTAELQIKHVSDHAKHVKELVFKFTCSVPIIGELKKSVFILTELLSFYYNQGTMLASTQNKVVTHTAPGKCP